MLQVPQAWQGLLEDICRAEYFQRLDALVTQAYEAGRFIRPGRSCLPAWSCAAGGACGGDFGAGPVSRAGAGPMDWPFPSRRG